MPIVKIVFRLPNGDKPKTPTERRRVLTVIRAHLPDIVIQDVYTLNPFGQPYFTGTIGCFGGVVAVHEGDAKFAISNLQELGCEVLAAIAK